jgi:excisionase family DNA binding protein
MEKRILSFEEAVAYTGFAESYMYKLTSARKIPHSKPNGKKIFFDKELLDKWLLRNPIATAEQINAEASTYISTH